MSVLEIAQQIPGQTNSPFPSGNVEEADMREDTATFASAGETLPVTQTERANYEFYCRVKQIEGARVRVYGGETGVKESLSLLCLMCLTRPPTPFST